MTKKLLFTFIFAATCMPLFPMDRPEENMADLLRRRTELRAEKRDYSNALSWKFAKCFVAPLSLGAAVLASMKTRTLASPRIARLLPHSPRLAALLRGSAMALSGSLAALTTIVVSVSSDCYGLHPLYMRYVSRRGKDIYQRLRHVNQGLARRLRVDRPEVAPAGNIAGMMAARDRAIEERNAARRESERLQAEVAQRDARIRELQEDRAPRPGGVAPETMRRVHEVLGRIDAQPDGAAEQPVPARPAVQISRTKDAAKIVLQRAIPTGNVERVRELCAAYPGIANEECFYDGLARRPLWFATGPDHPRDNPYEMIECLLESGASYRERMSGGCLDLRESLLDKALRSREIRILEMLVRHGAQLHEASPQMRREVRNDAEVLQIFAAAWGEDGCPICCAEAEAGVAMLPCGHIFCANCRDTQGFTYGSNRIPLRNCPTCRAQV